MRLELGLGGFLWDIRRIVRVWSWHGRERTPNASSSGPNGAGKTTFAEQFLLGEAECPEFINADLIARGLSPFAPGTVDFEAGRIMLSQIRAHAKAGKSFAFETTLSGTAYARLVPAWRAAGFRVAWCS